MLSMVHKTLSPALGKGDRPDSDRPGCGLDPGGAVLFASVAASDSLASFANISEHSAGLVASSRYKLAVFMISES
jgi:hypothetical protein